MKVTWFTFILFFFAYDSNPTNKLSAFVATILYSFLPVLTGMVSVTAAGFVMGPTSMPCLLATLKREQLMGPVLETNEVRWFLLSLFTKAADGLASG